MGTTEIQEILFKQKKKKISIIVTVVKSGQDFCEIYIPGDS